MSNLKGKATRTTKIEWCRQTWNPITGCTQISEECKNCYAKRMAHRLHSMGNPRYENEFQVTMHDDLVEKPYHWKKPREIFVCSMSDIMHEDVSEDFILRLFEVMNRTPQHKYYVLTKRSKRLVEMAQKVTWTDNIWVGVTVGSSENIARIDDLREVPAKVRFISAEPLLTSLSNLNLDGIHQVIVGGETGPGARPMDLDWARDIRNQSQEKGVAFFYKKVGGARRSEGERLLDGRLWEEYPNIPETPKEPES